MPRLLALYFILAFVLIAPAFADDPDVTTPTGLGVSIGDWVNPNFSGILKAGPGGTEMSFNKHLGLTNQSIAVPHFWYRWSHGQIFDFRFDSFSETVTTTLAVPETYQGVNFAAGTPVTTSFKAQWADLSYELPIAYDTFPPRETYLNAVANITAIRGVFTLTNNMGQSGTHPPITVPYPTVGLHGRTRVYQDTDLEFKATGMRFGFQDALGWSYALEGGVTQRIYEGLSVTGKYRYFTFYNRDSADNRLGFRLYGPEVSANYHF